MFPRPTSSHCPQVTLHFPDFYMWWETCFWVLASEMWGEDILAVSRLGPESPMRFPTFTLFAFQPSEHWRSGCVLRVRRWWYDQKERGFWVAGKRALPYKNQGEVGPTVEKPWRVGLDTFCLVCQWMCLSPLTSHSRKVLAQETFLVNQTRKIIIRQTTCQGRKGQTIRTSSRE